LHTRLFLDQVHANTIGGFLPYTNSPDPDFGKCLQCVAIDRARYNVNPPADRSSICARCLHQYCFDPNNLTSVSELPGRKLDFVDPSPQGVSAVTGFLADGRVPLILGFLGLVLVVAAISTFLILRKRRRSREAAYQMVVELHDEEEPPFMRHSEYRDNSKAEMHALGRLEGTRYVEQVEGHVAEEHTVEEHVAAEHIAEEHIAERHIAGEHIAEEHVAEEFELR